MVLIDFKICSIDFNFISSTKNLLQYFNPEAANDATNKDKYYLI